MIGGEGLDKEKIEEGPLQVHFSGRKVVVNGRSIPLLDDMPGRSFVISNGLIVVDGYRLSEDCWVKVEKKATISLWKMVKALLWG